MPASVYWPSLPAASGDREVSPLPLAPVASSKGMVPRPPAAPAGGGSSSHDPYLTSPANSIIHQRRPAPLVHSQHPPSTVDVPSGAGPPKDGHACSPPRRRCPRPLVGGAQTRGGQVRRGCPPPPPSPAPGPTATALSSVPRVGGRPAAPHEVPSTTATDAGLAPRCHWAQVVRGRGPGRGWLCGGWGGELAGGPARQQRGGRGGWNVGGGLGSGGGDSKVRLGSGWQQHFRSWVGGAAGVVRTPGVGRAGGWVVTGRGESGGAAHCGSQMLESTRAK